MIYLHFNSRSYELPSNWNELSARQLRLVLPLLFGADGVSMRHRIAIFKILSGWSYLKIFSVTRSFPWQKTSLSADERLLNLYEAIETGTSFLLEDISLTRNLLPTYEGFQGPADELSNVVAAEFCFSEIAFLQWKQNRNVSYLNSLVAILYRPGKSSKDRVKDDNGDLRYPFYPHLTVKYERIVRKWPYCVKLMIAMYYEGCRRKKIEENENLFSGSDSESLYGLWSVLREIARSGHFGDFDKVQNQFIDTIFMELQEVQAEHDRLKSKSTSNELL